MSGDQLTSLAVALAFAAATWAIRRRVGGRGWWAGVGLTLACLPFAAGLIAVPPTGEIVTDLAAEIGPWIVPAVAVFAFLETGAMIGLVAPAELILVIGGICAQQGEAELPVLLLVAWAASATGDLVGYSLGRRFGTRWLLRYGPAIGATAPRVEAVQERLRRGGAVALFAGRFVGFARPLLPFFAAAAGMPRRRFAAVSILSAGVWSATYLAIGQLAAGSLLDGRTDALTIPGAAVAGLIVASAVVVLWRRRRRRQHERAGGRTRPV